MNLLNQKRELGSLAAHRAFLGKPPKKGSVVPFPCEPRKVFAAQVAGLAKRLKAIRCRDVVIGLSGGLDSTLALLVTDAAFAKLKLDKRGIHVYTMPGFGTSKRTKGNADLLCEGLGLKLETISIVKSVRQHLKDIGHDGKTPDVTYENAQARMRTMMFAVNNDVPKTVVRKVCQWWILAQRRRGAEGVLRAADAVEDIINTPVSPELVKGQVTEDKIGPYELHDFFLWNFIMNEMGSKDLQKAAEKYFLGPQNRKSSKPQAYSSDLIAATLKTFLWRFFTQAFKRNCQPDGIKVFPFELSLHDWWIPSDLGFVRL